MAKNTRRQFTEDFKQQVLNAYHNRRKTGDTTLSIARKFSIDRIYIYKWIKADGVNQSERDVETTLQQARQALRQPDLAKDPRDKLISDLQEVVVSLTLKINKLEHRDTQRHFKPDSA